jgi:hypothetical protein
VEDGLIPRNVAHGVKVSQAGKEEVRPLSPEQTLGHSTIAVTLDVYSHMIPGMGDQVVQAMEDALS